MWRLLAASSTRRRALAAVAPAARAALAGAPAPAAAAPPPIASLPSRWAAASFASSAKPPPPPPPPTDGDDDEDWGARAASLESADDLLDAWADLLDAGDHDGVLRLLEAATKDTPGLPPLADVWAAAATADDDTAARRAYETAAAAEAASRRTALVDGQGRAYATGRRKEATARVWVRKGGGSVRVNGVPLDAFFASLSRRADVLSPFVVTDTLGGFDVRATVTGGGTTGQAQAVRHGVARALQLYDPSFRPPLKAAGLLTRDPRAVERKKPGRAKARKAFQWVKR